MTNAFDTAWDSASDKPLGIQNGEHLVIVKGARVDQNEYGRSIVFDLYYPAATTAYNSERAFYSLNPENQKALGITKRNLKVVKYGRLSDDDPSVQSSEINDVLNRSINGKARVRRSTTPKKSGEGNYINFTFLSFEPAVDPYSAPGLELDDVPF